VSDALRSLAIWTRTGNRTHLQPWHTYFRWLAREDAPLLILGMIGSVLAFWQGRNRFAMFAALWAFGMLAAYSLIPYKTPWLALNSVVPLALVSGWTAETVFVRATTPWRRRAVVAGLLVIAASAYQSFTLNFVRYDDDRSPYVYSQTRRAALDLVARIDRIMARPGPPLTIAVAAPEYFPLSWYLKDYQAGYYGRVPDTRDALFIGSTKQDDALKKQLGAGFVRSGPYALRPGVDLVLYVRQDVMVP
jgi:predicted membrane-bound mannosyltransferase